MFVASATPSDTRRAHVRHPSSSDEWSVVSVSPRMTIVKAMRPWLLTAIGMPTMAMTNAINSTELMTVSDDNMSNDDDDAERDLNDHNDKYDDDDDDDAEQVLIGGDDPVCKSCGNFGHRSHRDHRCPNHHCAHCHKQGRTKRFCPDVQCPHFDLFGHVNKKDCKYKHCINVEVDWLNILLSVSASHTITELFKASECTVDPNSLRSGGKFRKFADCQWEHVKQTCDSIGAQQLHTIIIGIRDSHPPRNAPYGAWGRKAPGVGARARRAQSRAH